MLQARNYPFGPLRERKAMKHLLLICALLGVLAVTDFVTMQDTYDQ